MDILKENNKLVIIAVVICAIAFIVSNKGFSLSGYVLDKLADKVEQRINGTDSIDNEEGSEDWMK